MINKETLEEYLWQSMQGFPYGQQMIGSQVHENISYSIKDYRSHIDQCQVPYFVVKVFI
jgi:hypothetical protein